MDQFCRFCGEKKENLSPIKNMNPSIVLWLSKILILEEENLPSKLCYTCLCTIEDVNYFIEKCLKTFENLKKGLKNITENKSIEYLSDSEDKEEMKEEYLLDNELLLIDQKDEVWFENGEKIESAELIELKRTDSSGKFKQAYKCSVCLLEFETSKSKSIHYITHMNEKDLKKYNYKCRFCEFGCNDREKVAYHMKRDHLNNNKNALFKDLLAIVIDQREKLNKTRKSIENNTDLIEFNNILMDETNSLIDDENNKHKIEQSNIDYMKILNLSDVYECKICKINFSRKTSFNKHWDALHLSEEEKELKRRKNKSCGLYLCPECGKCLPSAFKLDYHIRMHKNDRQYKCTLCQKSYFSKSHLETHMYRHTGDESNKTYICKLCNKRFRTPHELKIHTRFHASDRPFKCNVCYKAFYVISHLNDHKKTHTGEKNFICSYLGCSASYRFKTSLTKHYEKHVPDDKKTYTCEACEKRFSKESILKEHKREHNKKILLKEDLVENIL